MTIGLRIAGSKDQIVMNTANAMLSQMVTKVFERVLADIKIKSDPNQKMTNAELDKLKSLNKDAPNWLSDSTQDAYMLLQVVFDFFLNI